MYIYILYTYAMIIYRSVGLYFAINVLNKYLILFYIYGILLIFFIIHRITYFNQILNLLKDEDIDELRENSQFKLKLIIYFIISFVG